LSGTTQRWVGTMVGPMQVGVGGVLYFGVAVLGELLEGGVGQVVAVG